VARWLGRALGRRGAILGGYGTVWLLYGYGQLVQPPPDQRGLSLLLAAMPLAAWAWLWMMAGLVAIVCAFLPQGLDVAGFVALVVIVLPWMLGYLASWWPLAMFPRGWIAALIWGAITMPVIVVAGWSEPPRKRIEHV
jgi:hypothetical protein